jgi:hypothetical protein
LPFEKMGATSNAKVGGVVMTGTSVGIMKSYLQPLMNNENKIKIRNIVRFFMIYIFNVNTKKDFNL